MKVYIVMGNDYPDSVWMTERGAKACVADKKKQPESNHESGFLRIYWRHYEFKLQSRFKAKRK